jgi:bifunctional ADP-heptose synthase (sugar kinase/adenylyltransferase)
MLVPWIRESKINSVEAAIALAGGDRLTLLVTGPFDVLLAVHLRELAGARESLPDAPLLVAIAEPPHPLLNTRARAEMVAALAMVDYVVSLEESHIESLLAAFPPDRIVRLEAAHQQHMRELIEHVRRRQSA